MLLGSNHVLLYLLAVVLLGEFVDVLQGINGLDIHLVGLYLELLVLY